MRAGIVIVYLSLLTGLVADAIAEVTPGTAAVVIVSAHQTVTTISSADLRRIFLGQMTRWPNRRRIVVLVRPADSPEQRLLLHRIVRMTDIDYSQHWLGQVFRGEAPTPPMTIGSSEALKRAVASNPDAIGILLSSDLDARDLRLVRLLPIDGKLPGKDGYLLQW